MSFYSYNAPQNQPVSAGQKDISKTLGKSFLYLALGLFISAVVAFFAGLFFSRTIFPGYEVGDMEADSGAFVIYLIVMIACFIVMLVTGTRIRSRFAFSSKKSILPLFLLYSVVMGIFLSSFLVAGVDFEIIGEAAGIASLTMLILALVGMLAPNGVKIGAFIGISILSSLVSFFFFGFILFLFFPGLMSLYSLIFEFAFGLVFISVVASDLVRCRELIESGQEGNNVPLYVAFVIYCDFITLVVRLIRLLTVFKRRK